MPLTKIISGGQTGVDIAALRAAKAVGLETGGWMPFGFRTEDGIKPEYVSLYGMKQTGSSSYNERTKRNVWEADLTVLIGTHLNSPGSRLAKGYISEFAKDSHSILWGPHDHIMQSYADNLVRYLSYGIYRTVNIAGNRDPALEAPVEAWLTLVFRRVLEMQQTQQESK